MATATPLAPVPTPTSTAELLLQAQAGDRAAEAALCLRFVPAVRTFARRRLRSADTVAEFTQDALLLLVEAVRRRAVEDPERVGGFVLGICRNLAHDRVKQRERREALWDKYGADLAPVTADEPEYGSYETMHLEDFVSQLSKRARDVLRLSYAEGKSHGDIAQLLATSEANARVLRHRTLDALRDCMAKRISWEAA
jgi:RNA polymerase sigma factor (sigma-70 family)